MCFAGHLLAPAPLGAVPPVDLVHCERKDGLTNQVQGAQTQDYDRIAHW